MVRMLPGSLILALSIILATATPQAGVVRHGVLVDQSEVVFGQDKAGLISVSMDRAVTTNYLGFPELPYRVLSILIPQGEQVVSVRLEGVNTVELPLSADLAPFEGQYLDDGTTRGISAEASEILEDGSIF
ncbi:MAG TPA: hypothetical protein VLA34_10450, partial [Candidatus Krumholzibacterium sp.]|nr:hypothetical protein [Candidatus Krumholzibacterium sp.]